MYTKYRHLELNLMAMKINCAKPKKRRINDEKCNFFVGFKFVSDSGKIKYRDHGKKTK